MRVGELLLAMVVVFSIGLVIFTPRRLRWIRILTYVGVVGLGLQSVLAGVHWQAGPLYLASVLLAWPLLVNGNLGRWFSLLLVSVIGLLTVTTVAFGWLMPIFELPKPTGPYAIGTSIMHLVDPSRTETGGYSPSGKRELIVQMWYPITTPYRGSARLASYQRRKEVTTLASYRSVLKTHAHLDAAVAQGGPFPLLIYNPGWEGERSEGQYQMEDLASHGFVVIAVDHTFYGGKVEFPDGRVEDSHNAPVLGSFEHSTGEEQAALGSKFVHIEADDDVFVMNQLEAMNQDLGNSLYRRLDFTRVGAMGFSIGGAVAEQTALEDKRVKAALNLDGWSFGDVQQAGLAKPWMILYEDKRQTVPAPAQLVSGSVTQQTFWKFCQNDYDAVTRSMRQHGGYVLFLANANHVDFTDRSLFSPITSWTGKGKIGPQRAHAIVNAYTLAFFENALNGHPEPLLQTPKSPYPRSNSPGSTVQILTGSDRKACREFGGGACIKFS